MSYNNTFIFFKNSTRIIAHRRLIHSTRSALKDKKFPHGTLEQGHASKKVASGAKDMQAESVQAGYEQRGGNDRGHGAMNAASTSGQPKAHSNSSSKGGNPEKIGFAEQVGGATSSSNKFDAGETQGGGANRSEGRTAQGDEEAQAPGLLSSVKQALGFKTTSGDVKQNRGGGRGVTGTGTFGDSGRKQGLHTSAALSVQSGYRRIVEKDAPSPVDYMKDVAQDLAEAQSDAKQQRKHNLTHRHRELSRDLGQDGVGKAHVVETKSGTSLRPKTLPGEHAHAAKSTSGHESGEWSSAGLGDKQYRNVGGAEEPYEPPGDDEDANTKRDAQLKKLRYGGLAKDPKLV